MKNFLLIIFLLPITVYSQTIKWTTVPEDAINPDELVAKGIIELDNGDETPEAELSIDFMRQSIYYRNLINNAIFSIFKEDFARISVADYKDGEMVKDSEFYGDVGEEIGAVLRKGLYDKADLNVVNITSVVKEGFFRRSQPKFLINDGELDVSNKSQVVAKLLSINRYSLSYLDNEGDLWLRGNTGSRNVTAGAGTDKKEEREDRREARKQARILNLNFGDKFFLNTRELYDYFYDEYENNFYESLNEFRDDLLGRGLRSLLTSWGPHTEQYRLDDNSTLYVWSYERKVTETESAIVGAGTVISKLVQSSETQGNASISGQYGISSSASKTNLGGYGSIMSSYSSINGSSFLNYYSKNVINQYSSQQSSFAGLTKGTAIQYDDTKKIGLIVDNDLNIIDVIVKNFFPKPYYGITLNFIDED